MGRSRHRCGTFERRDGVGEATYWIIVDHTECFGGLDIRKNGKRHDPDDVRPFYGNQR
jgi:hypothetical protein